MKIKMKTSIAGPGLILGVGDIGDFPEDQAKRLIHKGFAEPVRRAPKKKTETATASADEVETATEE